MYPTVIYFLGKNKLFNIYFAIGWDECNYTNRRRRIDFHAIDL